MEVYSSPAPRAVEPPWAPHCRRVAALAVELGRRLRLKPHELQALEEAALHHHGAPTSGAAAHHETPLPNLALSAPAAALLEAVRQGPTAGSRAAAVLRVAEAFAERVEFLPFEPAGLEQILDEMSWLAQEGFYDRGVVAVLGKLVCIRMEDLLATVHRLPVFPAVALRALLIRTDEETGFEQMESLISSDQVLAGRIIEVANSSLFSPVRRISSIAQAMAYIGLEGSRRVVMAQVIRPLFASAALHRLWRHSLETAVKAERLAGLSRQAPAEEAFLAGLVHDVGRLALERLPDAEAAAYKCLLERGTDAVFAELLVCGFDHGTASAEILRSWSFPMHLVEGVEYHHRPESSDHPMAWLLHAAECWAGAGEDLPSTRRLPRALKCLGITPETLKSACEPEHWLLASLLEAA